MSRIIAVVTVFASALLVGSAVARAQPAEYKEVQHPQPGEVKYEDKWADVTGLFKQYKDAKKDFADVLEKKKAINDQLASIQKTLAGIESEYQKACTPIRQQQSAAGAKVTYCQRFLTLRPPAPPQNLVEPAYPNRAWYKDDNAYRNNVNSYQQRLDATRRENKNQQENYKKQMDQFNDNQKEAQRVLKESQDTVASCTKQLQELDTTRQGQMKDPVAQKQKTTAEQTVENQKALTLVALTGKLYDAIITCPDQQRYQRGIADYRKSLYTPDEIQAMLDKAKADLAAGPTSTSRQADVDELKVLADRTKTAAKL